MCVAKHGKLHVEPPWKLAVSAMQTLQKYFMSKNVCISSSEGIYNHPPSRSYIFFFLKKFVHCGFAQRAFITPQTPHWLKACCLNICVLMQI